MKALETNPEQIGSSAASRLSREDYAATRDALLTWRREGVQNPLIPSDVDINGDGIVDAYGLNELDEVIFVSGIELTNTVYLSEGDDAIEHEGEV